MISRLEALIRRRMAWPLHGRTFMSKRFRAYFDGGYPKFRWLPRFYRMAYDRYWCLRGFWVSWLGRCLHFSFGRDVHGLYADRHSLNKKGISK